MGVKPQKLTLEIPESISSYKMFIETCCNFVSDFNPLMSDFKRLSKFKLVIMELLTNAIKHGRKVSFLELSILENSLIIKKNDQGLPFFFQDAKTGRNYQLPLTGFQDTYTIEALLGNSYHMDLAIKSENCIEFLDKPEPEFVNIDELPENFGLLVIRRCASTFHYCHNPQTGENTFEVALNFN